MRTCADGVMDNELLKERVSSIIRWIRYTSPLRYGAICKMCVTKFLLSPIYS